MSTTSTYLEQHVLEALDMQEQIKNLQEKLEFKKQSIAEEMRLSITNELTIPLDLSFDVKVKLAERTTKKIDKEEMAKDMGVGIDKINVKFLIKAVEDRRLSYQRFLDYMYQNVTEGVSVRRVKAKGGKKRK